MKLTKAFPIEIQWVLLQCAACEGENSTNGLYLIIWIAIFCFTHFHLFLLPHVIQNNGEKYHAGRIRCIINTDIKLPNLRLPFSSCQQTNYHSKMKYYKQFLIRVIRWHCHWIITVALLAIAVIFQIEMAFMRHSFKLILLFLLSIGYSSSNFGLSCIHTMILKCRVWMVLSHHII